MRDYKEKDIVFLKDGRIVDAMMRSPVETVYRTEWVRYSSGKYFLETDVDNPPELYPVGQTQYLFEIEVISTRETYVKRQEFEVLLKNGTLYLVWELKNGQVAALPMSEKARQRLTS